MGGTVRQRGISPQFAGGAQPNEEQYAGRSPQSPYPHAVPPVVADAPAPFTREYMEVLRKQFKNSIDDIAQYYIDVTNRVDEYRVQSLGGETLTSEALTPDYECDEIITGIIVTGPPGGTPVIKLGKRAWGVVMPATGLLLISPIQIKLGRSDDRLLIASAVSLALPSQPAVPASTVAVQNTNPYTATVVISAGTITNVSVNGITVGVGAGTYSVPAYGAISITYSVAPTWTWFNGTPVVPAAGDWSLELTGYAETGRRGRV